LVNIKRIKTICNFNLEHKLKNIFKKVFYTQVFKAKNYCTETACLLFY